MKVGSLSQNDEQVISRAISRAWTDLDFRVKFLQDPKKILESFGIVFPGFVNIILSYGSIEKVAELENNDLKIYVSAVPDSLKDSELELNLETVSLFSCLACCCG